MKKYVVWQNYNLDEWGEELNDEYFEDQRLNLSVTVSGDIIAIADIGRWDGRKIGYKELHSNNLADCLQFGKDCDYAEWYVDMYGNFKSRQSHHDATNYIVYRAWKKGVTDEQKEQVLDGLYFGKISQRTISRYTESLGKYVANVYGWKLCGKR